MSYIYLTIEKRSQIQIKKKDILTQFINIPCLLESSINIPKSFIYILNAI